jgi:phospholipase/carboxylesterase
MVVEPPVEIQTSAAIGASVIWLHGLGADGHDFAGLVPELRLPATPGIRFVFPHAPMRPVTLNNGYVMRAWYDINFAGGGVQQNEAQLAATVSDIHALIAREAERGVPAERVVVAGFSQGGVVALYSALCYPQRLAGTVVLSAPVAASAERMVVDATPANAKLPVFLGYGRYDQLVPMALGLQLLAGLRARGYPVEWHDYPVEHSVCGEEVRAISDFLMRVVGAAAGAKR